MTDILRGYKFYERNLKLKSSVMDFNGILASAIQGGREISAIIVTDDYLCSKERKSPYNFFLILIFNELFMFNLQTNGSIERRGALL